MNGHIVWLTKVRICVNAELQNFVCVHASILHT